MVKRQFRHITPSQDNALIDEPTQHLPKNVQRDQSGPQTPMHAYGQLNSAPPQQSPFSQPFSAYNSSNAGPTTPRHGLPWMSEPPNQISPTGPVRYPGGQPVVLPPWQSVPTGYPGQHSAMQPMPPFVPPPGKKPPYNNGKKRRFPKWARVIVAVLIAFLILIGSGAGYYYATFDNTLKNTIGQTVTRLSGDNAPSGATGNTGDILSGNRINILLLGSDTDVKFMDASGKSTYIAQTDIVVTIDPKTQSVGMLSIPRDTWLDAPGYGMMKLDEAYGRGGVALSRYTIHQDLGIYIDYYAWVGLDGFIKVIDTAGGVDVDVTHPIIDDNYPDDIGNHGNDIYAMKRLSLAPGPQHLSGPEVLEYVRSRHADLVGDFGRSIRQQQVLAQLKTKLNSPNMVGKLPELANDLNGYVKTDMQLPDVLRLMNFARSLDQSRINRVTLGPPYSSSARVNGQDVVMLDCGQVQPVIAKMFDLGDNAKCNLQASSMGTPTQTAHVAQSSPQASVLASPLWQAAGRVAHDSTMNLRGSEANLSGMHGLLDLMFFVVFESPEAIKV